MASLKGHKDLGIHTEMFSDGVVDLAEEGVITNAYKHIHPGKIVTGFVVGTKRVYDFIHENPHKGSTVINKRHKIKFCMALMHIDQNNVSP